MICSKCGSELPNNCKFCFNCGSIVESESKESIAISTIDFARPDIPISPLPYPQHAPSPNYTMPPSYSDVFVDPNEQLLDTLGNGYLNNLLFGNVKKCHALLTDKRVYFQGTFFSNNGKKMIQEISEKTVDLEDITGTGFRYSRPIGIIFIFITLLIPFILTLLFDIDGQPDETLIFGIISFSIAIAVLIIKFILNRKVYFILEYAGGAIRFNASIIGLSKVREFQKKIRLAKDSVRKTY